MDERPAATFPGARAGFAGAPSGGNKAREGLSVPSCSDDEEEGGAGAESFHFFPGYLVMVLFKINLSIMYLHLINELST
jgi:hypothetical protein